MNQFNLRQQTLRKVPEITLVFWLVKLLTTAMGEATSDFFVAKINPYIAVSLGALGLIIALFLQFKARRYYPWIYWLTVVMVAIFGTMAADVLHVQLGIAYIVSTSFFLITLLAIFIFWQKSEGTLSIHSITSTRRELFYWAAVLATFALGTAAGDMTATTLSLGYLTSGSLFAALIAAVAIGYFVFKLPEIFSFWLAYILTRPLGASFADWLGKPHTAGIGFGDGHVSLVLSALIICLVAYMALDQKNDKTASIVK